MSKPIDTLAEYALNSIKTKGSMLRAVERAIVLRALKRCEGNVAATARLLGIDRKAAERRVARARSSRA